MELNCYWMESQEVIFSTKTCKIEFGQNPNNFILKQNLGGEI